MFLLGGGGDPHYTPKFRVLCNISFKSKKHKPHDSEKGKFVQLK
jgi:hypothetical protein